MAKLRQAQGWNIADGDDTTIVNRDADGKNLKEAFYRVASVLSFKPNECGGSDTPTTRLYFAEDDKIRYIDVNLSMRNVEEITSGYHRMGTPLYQKIIDLRPKNQAQITEDYKCRIGMFGYLKKQDMAIS